MDFGGQRQFDDFLNDSDAKICHDNGPDGGHSLMALMEANILVWHIMLSSTNKTCFVMINLCGGSNLVY
jgi:hypothetical protein